MRYLDSGRLEGGILMSLDLETISQRRLCFLLTTDSLVPFAQSLVTTASQEAQLVSSGC